MGGDSKAINCVEESPSIFSSRFLHAIQQFPRRGFLSKSRKIHKGYNDTTLKGLSMDSRAKMILIVAGAAIVAYSIGYQKAQARTIRELGTAASKEALIYLATQDHIRSRFGR